MFVPSFVNLTTADKESNMLVQKLREANVTYPFGKYILWILRDPWGKVSTTFIYCK